MKKIIFCLPAIVAFMWGCGKKGPLFLEPEKLPLAVTNLELRQVGHEIELCWKYPALLSDKKTPLLSSQVRGVSVYHLAKPFSPDAFEKKSEILARPKAAELIGRGDSFAFVVPFKAKTLKDREHAFALTYQVGRSRSALSAVERITTRIPPEPVRDLKIGREGKVVVLSWTRPQVDSEGQPLPALAGYRVYRRIVQGKAPEAFAPVNARPVRGEYFEDDDTGADGEYEYRVSSIIKERIESAPSTIVKTKIQDTFPPDVPANLVTFSAKDHVFLTWEAVRDRDLDHYILYRKSAKDEDFKVLDAIVAENLYRDRHVVKGQLYLYAVAAVDRKGNESEPGLPARHKFE